LKLSFAERVYETMQGNLLPMDMIPGVEDAFAQGEKCAQLYAEVYAAERRLEDRLGMPSHDADVETLIRALLDIQEELCYRMYAYGAKYGMRE